jgi:transposase
MSKAIDEIRASEARQLRVQGRLPILTRARWILLKRPENLTADQEVRLADLLRYNLRSIRAYLLKEDFQFFCGGGRLGRRPPHVPAAAVSDIPVSD